MKTIITLLMIISTFATQAQPPKISKIPNKIPKPIHFIPETAAAFERTYAFHMDGDYLDVWIDDATVLHFSSNRNIDKRSITTYASKADWMNKKGNEHIINTTSPVKHGDTSLTSGEYKNMYGYVMSLHVVGASNNYQTIFIRK